MAFTSNNALIKNISQVWSFPKGFFWSYTDNNDNIYINTSTGFSKLDPNGNLLWEKSIAYDGNIYITSDAIYRVVEIVSGKVTIDKFTINGEFIKSIQCITSDTGFFGYAFNSRNKIYVDNTGIYIAASKGGLFKFDENGNEIWHTTITTDGKHYQLEIIGYYENYLYIRSNWSVYRYQISTTSPLGEVVIDRGTDDIQLCSMDSQGYLYPAYATHVSKFDITSKTIVYDKPYTIDTADIRVASKSGELYLGIGNILTKYKTDGTVEWTYDQGSPIPQSFPIIDSKNNIIISNFESGTIKLEIDYNDAPTLPVISLESDYYSYTKLTWPKSTDTEGDQIFYDIEMQDVTAGGAYTIIGTVDNNTIVGDTVTFNYELPVKKTTVLAFRVKARDIMGQSSEYTIPTTVSYYAFSQITNFKCEGDFRIGGKIKFTWDPIVNSGTNPIVYKIYLNTMIATVPEGTTSYEYIIPDTFSSLVNIPIKPGVKVVDSITSKGRPAVYQNTDVTIRANTAPNKSGSILYDTGISIGLQKVTALWEVVTDGSDTVTYDVDLYDNGSWVNIATGLNVNSHDCPLPDKDLVKAKLRVRSFDGLLYSDYMEGPIFTNFKATHHVVTTEHLLSALSSAKAFIVSSIQTIKIATVSLLTNDAGYKTVVESDAVINPVLDQAKAYVNQAIGGLTQFITIKVDALPTVDIKEKTLYLVPSPDAKDDNILDEYLYIDSKWEFMGTKKLDLSNYDDKTVIDTKLTALSTLNSGITPAEMDEINTTLWS